MEFRVRLSGATIKALEGVLRQGYRTGEVRVIRRVQALLEVGVGRPVRLVADRLGLDASTVYGWLHLRLRPSRPGATAPLAGGDLASDFGGSRAASRDGATCR